MSLNSNVVSIPQGTIKRKAHGKDLLNINTFQFHKVRLKAGTATITCAGLPAFQFHKVRLKEVTSRLLTAADTRFNSTRYD